MLRTFAVLAVLLTVPLSARAQAKAEPLTGYLNEYFARQWQTQKLTPAERTSDEEYLRRVRLDITGRIATGDEVRAFVKDTSADKRAKLVDSLLASDDFASNRATLWVNWLLPRGTEATSYAHLHRWLTESTGKRNYEQIVSQLIATTGNGSDNGAVQFVLGNLGRSFPQKQWTADGAFDMVPATTRTLRLFLGLRLVAYHLPDHPVHPDFKPEHFWGVNAFYRQAYVRDLGLHDLGTLNEKAVVSFQDKDGKTQQTEAVFLDGRKPHADQRTRRQLLADFVTTHPNFPKAYVNRIWGRFFGRGLHERPVVDDFGSHHKLMHPKLLDRLAKELVDSKYNAGHIIRALCASDVYQLRSTSNPSNLKEETEVYFSRMPLKLMTPDELANSLLVAAGPSAAASKLRAGARQHSSRRLGDQEWDEVPFQERIIHNVVFINRKDVNDLLLDDKAGPVARAVALQAPDKIIEALYLNALNRRPTAKEVAHVQGLLEKDGKEALPVWQDLYWALINSSEFILNH